MTICLSCGKLINVSPGFCMICGATLNTATILRQVAPADKVTVTANKKADPRIAAPRVRVLLRQAA